LPTANTRASSTTRSSPSSRHS
jgi:hypothetical protein